MSLETAVVAVALPVVVALIAATVGIRLDRTFQTRDALRDLYLEYLDLINDQVLHMRQLINEPSKQEELLLEFERRYYRALTRLELLAPKSVQVAVVRYHNAAALFAQTTSLHDPVQLMKDARTLPERQTLSAAMRKDLAGRKRSRRTN